MRNQLAGAIALALIVLPACSNQTAGAPEHAVKTAASGDYGNPPAGESLFYVGDPKHAGWYIGFDWTGKPRDTIKLASPLDEFSNLVQSPDGSAFLVDVKGTNTVPALDRLGRPQDAFPVPSGMRELVWADDNRHLCSLSVQHGRVILSWHVPTYTANIADIGKAPAIPENGYGYGIRSCSFATDQRAVIEHDSPGPIPLAADYRVIGLGDGRVLASQKIGAPPVANTIVVSHDSSLVALNSLGASSPGFLDLTAHTAVVDLRTKRTVNLDPRLAVIAFSGDDKMVLATGLWAAGAPTQLETIELATGNVVWRYDGDGELAALPLAEPGGESFALFLKKAGDQDMHAAIQVTIEHADGTATTVPGRFVQP